MKKPVFALAASLIALSACSETTESDTASEAIAAASGSTNVSLDATGQVPELTASLPASVPKLAYVYGLGFRLPLDDVGKLMRRHADVCEQQGPSSCRIVGMDLSGEPEQDEVSGRLQLAVAANNARVISALLEKEADGIGAEQTSTTIASEEVSKTIIDTEARIRAREDLRDRLTQILRTRQGDLKDLVEAERQVAAVNEEIDQARSWLAETRGRVAFSRMDVDYRSQPAAGAAFLNPIASAVGSLGPVMGFVFAALLMIGAVLAPIGALVWAGRRIRRQFGVPRAEA